MIASYYTNLNAGLGIILFGVLFLTVVLGPVFYDLWKGRGK